jgi:ABC-type multidrug transport system ATPase subunit/ABC-type transporter Mla maintaining outer membrane lipid asymmetry permease subunit MlaE
VRSSFFSSFRFFHIDKTTTTTTTTILLLLKIIQRTTYDNNNILLVPQKISFQIKKKPTTIHNNNPQQESQPLSSSLMTTATTTNNNTEEPIVSVKATPIGPKSPFGSEITFSVYERGCIFLQGPSGRGKTTIVSVLAGLVDSESVRKTLDLDVTVKWNPSVPLRERCGILFQQTTLVDELTVIGNLTLALQQCPSNKYSNVTEAVKELLDIVGLDYDKDGPKLPTQLSGGMGRRVCLALQLAQHKHVVVLDEPFTGLDYESAVEIANELTRIRKTQKTALILISHEPHLTKLVMDPRGQTFQNEIVELKPPLRAGASSTSSGQQHHRSVSFGIYFYDRFIERLIDYVVYSFPLIALAFIACGLAISMLTADLLERLEISGKVLELVEQEVKPLLKLLTGGEDVSMIQMMAIRFKVNAMLNQTIPPAKATLYVIGLTKLFVLEVGPLLTALLLCGRIGGSYAGKVGTMQATNQNKLLQTLGISPRYWTFYPSLLAALLAGPILTLMGTGVALYLSGYIGPLYGIGNTKNYWNELQSTLFPVLRLQCFEPFWNVPITDDIASIEENTTDSVSAEGSCSFVTGGTRSLLSAIQNAISDPTSLDLRVTYNNENDIKDTLIELATYPPIYHLLKAQVFIVIIICVAEVVARSQRHLTPRGVPSVITFSVVTAGLLVILADWGFSQLWLLRE